MKYKVILQSLSFKDNLLFASFLEDSNVQLKKSLLELIRTAMIDSNQDTSSDINDNITGTTDNNNIDNNSNNNSNTKSESSIPNGLETESLSKKVDSIINSMHFIDLDAVCYGQDEESNQSIDVKFPPIRVLLPTDPIGKGKKKSFFASTFFNVFKNR